MLLAICEGNPSAICGFPSQRAGNGGENLSLNCHDVMMIFANAGLGSAMQVLSEFLNMINDVNINCNAIAHNY